MAKKPVVTIIPRENIPEAPSWINNLLYPINLFIQGVQNGWIRLNYAENFDTDLKTLTFTGSSTPTDNVLSFALKKVQRPKEVRARQIHQSNNLGDTFTEDIKYTYNNGVLTITSIPNLTNGVDYTIDILVMYE